MLYITIGFQGKLTMKAEYLNEHKQFDLPLLRPFGRDFKF